MIYLTIKQNLLNLAAGVEFIKTNTLQEKPQSFWFMETKSDIQAQQNSRCKYV